ncbi:MAG: 23S rRNA (uracil(1939)-C(5))-methyltransferase RlmD [Erysipelotrichaceae bacterium]|nr:23S rRNA (uracil(1939)-C(5))-methyltransferase RlmD [Erysipelotrichaceae bacterium]
MKKCPVSSYCGGCQYQGMAYEKQLEEKQRRVEELLSCFCHVEKIIPCKESSHYRNKMQVGFGYDDKHHIICGYYIPESHMILPIDECMICDPLINKVYSSLKRIVISNRIPIYDERLNKGCLRHALIRSNKDGDVMLVLVTGSMNLVKKDLLVKQILHYNPEVKTIVHNINHQRTSAILGNKNNVLFGKGYIVDQLFDLKFRISPASFYQVNRHQTEVLYKTAVDLLELKDNESVIDAYCGTGTIGLYASRNAFKVYGVESNLSAVKDADRNKKMNEIYNVDFICEDAGKYMEDLSKRKSHCDALIMDPPRAGSDKRFMSSAIKLSPDKIVYISCNPVTLKRDLSYIKRYYSIKKIIPVDMFPYTQHVEVVSLLQKMSNTRERTITLDVEMEDYYRLKNETEKA